MTRWLKRKLRSIFPTRWVNAYRRWRYGRTWFDPTDRSVATVFSEIYRHNVWGGSQGKPYSGPGSDPDMARSYVLAAGEFIRTFDIKSILDLGCGDFRIGEQLARLGVSYHGIDVVPDLIALHEASHARNGISFSCQDAITDDLPDVDLCLIRQVLQHLSNEQVQRILSRCARFRYVIVTEGVLTVDVIEANRDIVHGNETRLEHGSCLVLDKPPFNLCIEKILCEVKHPAGYVIRAMQVVIPKSD